MLFLLGSADNWTRAEHCLDFAAYLKKSNPRIEVKVYSGAHHAWDSPAADGRLIPIPSAQNVTGCDTVLTNADGSGVETRTGRRMSKAERDQALAACCKSSTVNIQANRAIRARQRWRPHRLSAPALRDLAAAPAESDEPRVGSRLTLT